MCRVHRAFEAFDNPYQDLALFVELRIFFWVWWSLSTMDAQHRPLSLLTRHSKILIHPSCKGTEPFWILKFLSDQARLSVRWSCPLHILLPTKCPSYKMLQSSSLVMRSLSQMREEYCCTGLTDTSKIIFHYRKYIWVHNTTPWLMT
jgi:hypothetical protein